MRKPLSYLPILLCNVTKDPHLWSRSCHFSVCDSMGWMRCFTLDVWWVKYCPRLASRDTHAPDNRVASRLVRAFALHFRLPIASFSDCWQPVRRHVLLFIWNVPSVKMKGSQCMCETCCCVYTVERGGRLLASREFGNPTSWRSAQVAWCTGCTRITSRGNVQCSSCIQPKSILFLGCIKVLATPTYDYWQLVTEGVATVLKHMRLKKKV